MSLAAGAALVAAALLASVAVLQVLLALGAPLGAAAWGGAHRVLPGRLRLGSAAAAAVLCGAGWVVLARAGLLAPGPEPLAIRVATFVFAGFFALNTLGNAASKSRLEQRVMTPVTAALVVCFLLAGIVG